MQTIGERLEDARKKRGVSIREVAEATKVRGDYLQRFESNQFDIGLTDIYVRGFLRNYAHFLKLPADRILADYAALGHNEPRPRQPSREVYGRMDLPGTEERTEAPAAPPADEPPRQQPRVPRSATIIPAGPMVDPNLIYKGGIILVGVLALVLLIWGAKAFLSAGSAEPKAAPAAPVAAAPAAADTVAVIALADVRVKVSRQSDGAELYQGPMAANERREFPNVPLRVTATALESLRIEYKGARYSVAKSGYGQAAFDFTGK